MGRDRTVELDPGVVAAPVSAGWCPAHGDGLTECQPRHARSASCAPARASASQSRASASTPNAARRRAPTAARRAASESARWPPPAPPAPPARDDRQKDPRSSRTLCVAARRVRNEPRTLARSMLRQMKPRGPTAIRLGRRARADVAITKSCAKTATSRHRRRPASLPKNNTFHNTRGRTGLQLAPGRRGRVRVPTHKRRRRGRGVV
jgi:hypothetical protein